MEEQKIKNKKIENQKQELKQELTLGLFLRKAREARGLDLDRVVKETKILKDILLNLEKEEFQLLPPPVYLKGILKRYARYLKIDFAEVLKLYEQRNHRNLVSGRNDMLPHNRFAIPFAHFVRVLQSFLPRLFKWIFILIICLYFFYEISLLILPPKIILRNPVSDITTNQQELLIQGEVWRTKELFLNGHPLSFDKKGNFKEKIILNEGLNRLEIKAVNSLGKTTQIERNIIYTP